MNNDFEKLQKTCGCVGLVLLIPVIFLYAIFTFGFVFSHLWLWFITPIGFPAISLLHAYGLCLMVWILSIRPTIYKEESKELDWGKVVGLLTGPWWSLLIGYVVHLYM